MVSRCRQHRKLLRKRADYASYRINGNKLVRDDGTFIDPRHACPNTRPTNPAKCENGVNGIAVPNSTLKLPIKALNAQVKPAACTQRTLTIPTAVGIAGEQAHPYKSPEWKATHNRLRSGNEGTNGNLKSPGGVAIGTPGRRRIRGRAPNAIMSSVMLAAANVTAIRNFLQNATPDEDGTLKRRYSTYRRTRATEKAAAKNQQKAAARRRAKPTLRKQPTAMTRAVSARTGNLRT